MKCINPSSSSAWRRIVAKCATCFTAKPRVLPVALGAEQEREAVLVLQLVHGRRLGDTGQRRDRPGARVFLVDPGPVEVTREGQVLDRNPTDDHADLLDVEVRGAGAGQRQSPDA